MSVPHKKYKDGPLQHYTSILMCPECGQIYPLYGPAYFTATANKDDDMAYGPCNGAWGQNHKPKLPVIAVDPTEGVR